MDLKTWRKKEGLTQRELADLTGLSDVTICRYESRERKPTEESVIMRLYEVTKGQVTPNDFYDLN